MVIEAVTGIIGGKKAKKAAKKQKRIQIQVNKLQDKALAEAKIQEAIGKEQFEIEKAVVREQRRQDRINTIREGRMRRAAILASTQASGLGQGSSAVTGGLGSLSTAFASTIGLSNVFTGLQDRSAAAQTRSMESQGRVTDIQGQVAKLQGQSQLVQADLAKSQANISMWGNVAKLGVELATMAFPQTRGTSFGSPQFFTAAFGGKTTPVK